MRERLCTKCKATTASFVWLCEPCREGVKVYVDDVSDHGWHCNLCGAPPVIPTGCAECGGLSCIVRAERKDDVASQAVSLPDYECPKCGATVILLGTPSDSWRIWACEKCEYRPPRLKNRTGRKDDSGKDPWDLLPWIAIEQIVKVLEHGRKKYAAEGWRRVPDLNRRYFAAIMRHLIHWLRGKSDPDTGLHPLAHAACDILFILEHEQGTAIPVPFQKGEAADG